MYLGNQPALSYTSFAKQDFTTSATTSYTLDNPVTNENEIALFINFVRQEPTTAYTASGTSLTLTSATSASDDMYCVFLGKAVQTVNPPSGSVGISQLSATGTKDNTTFLRGDNTFASAGGDNTPAFYGQLASDQTMTRNATVKITGMTSNEIDTNSAFDGTTFTVPNGEGGNYYLEGTIVYDFETAGDDGFEVFAAIYKNGSTLKGSQFMNISTQDLRHVSLDVSGIFNLSAGNTIELYSYSTDSNGGDAKARSNKTSIGGYKIIT